MNTEIETDFYCDKCGEDCVDVYCLDGHVMMCEDCFDELPQDVIDAYWKAWENGGSLLKGF